jgi:hypothetical protein
MVDESLPDAYWLHHRLFHSKDRGERLSADQYSWAWETVWETMERGGPDAIRLLFELADAAPDEDAIAYLGAGPIEDLLHERRAEDLDLLDEAARKDRRIRLALQHVEWPHTMSAEEVARFRRYDSPA